MSAAFANLGILACPTAGDVITKPGDSTRRASTFLAQPESRAEFAEFAAARDRCPSPKGPGNEHTLPERVCDTASHGPAADDRGLGAETPSSAPCIRYDAEQSARTSQSPNRPSGKACEPSPSSEVHSVYEVARSAMAAKPEFVPCGPSGRDAIPNLNSREQGKGASALSLAQREAGLTAGQPSSADGIVPPCGSWPEAAKQGPSDRARRINTQAGSQDKRATGTLSVGKDTRDFLSLQLDDYPAGQLDLSDLLSMEATP